MQHIETEDPNKPANHTKKQPKETKSQQMEADSGTDFTAGKLESYSPEKHAKKKKNRKKSEIQLADGAEAVTAEEVKDDKNNIGNDLTATDVVEEAPSPFKSGGDKKSRKRKKEADVPTDKQNTAKISEEDDSTTMKPGPKRKRNKEKDVGVGGSGHLGENATAEMGGSGKEGDSDDSATSKPRPKKKRNKEKNVGVGGMGHLGENGTVEMRGSGKEGDSDDSATSKPGPKKKRNKEKDVGVGGSGHLGENGTTEMGGSGKEVDSDDSATSKPRPKKKRNKGKDVAAVGTDRETSNASKIGASDNSQNANPKMKKPSKPRKRVSFAGEVEVFDDKGKSFRPKENDDALVQGKRFTPEEDDIIKEAVRKYIEGNQLGKEGLQMVLNNKKYPHLIGCWKEIGASLPWRPFTAVYFRAHNLFERSEARKWQPHEYETLTRLHEQFGSDWKIIGAELGKHRIHVKDTWRRIGMANRNRGHWSQEEYQSLFDLVNFDLAMKAFDEKKTKHGMLRDNISWEAISTKMSTRPHSACCNKWYQQLSSPLVSQGLWLDTDDYRLLDALQKLDACCIDDVDWDNLIKYRPGDICRKRWDQMVRHIGGHREKSFIEQLDVLSKRYCPEMLEYRKDEGCSNATTLSSGTSLQEETVEDKHVEVP